MKIIKLNATDSTNSFLKGLKREMPLENLTTVVAKAQLKGRGQRGSRWQSQPGKNLLCSVLLTFDWLPVTHQNYLNYAVSLSLFELLTAFEIPELKIKWPNDILSSNYKIGGILIENTLKNQQVQSSIVGIGLNVNQQNFKNLPSASSIKNCIQKTLNLEAILQKLLLCIEKNRQLLLDKKYDVLEERYLKSLYKKGIRSTFRDEKGHLFKGIITGVTPLGKLRVLKGDQTIKTFGIKEISFVL